MVKYLILFPSAALVLEEGEREAMCDDAHALIKAAKG